MASGEFGWFELAYYDRATVTEFYQTVMGWPVRDSSDPDGIGPHIIASTIEMPEALAALNMPPFWMSYIEVDDIAATCQHAKTLGGTVDIYEKGDPNTGSFALIRDPSGAGFSAFSGWDGRPLSRKAGHRCGHILFTQNPDSIRTFYEDLFGWTMEQSGDGYHVQAGSQRIEISNALPQLRGIYSFWSVMIAVPELDGLPTIMQKTKGRLLIKAKTRYGHSAWIADPEGAVIGFVQKPMLGGWRDWMDAMF